jgi:hypothetical protein
MVKIISVLVAKKLAITFKPVTDEQVIYMTSFYVTSFICSSERATLTSFSMTSALVQKLAC